MLPGPRAENPAERVLQASSSALTGTAGPVFAGRNVATQTAAPGLQAVGREVSRAPIGQIITAPVATAVGQTVTEATDSPLAGLVSGVGTSMLAGVRPVKREAVPSTEELLKQSKLNYDILDKSGLQFDAQKFQQHMSGLPTKLRKELGYVESMNPKVASAFRELLANNPKDIAEITALRRAIGNAAGSADATERKIASRLLDEFDDYVLNAPPGAIVSGNKSSLEAWKAARADYAKVKKSELIEDIVSRAEVSQGGKEATIAQGLSALAKDKKKMRFFTPDEQEAIREAAKGGTLQSMLRTVSKFTPMTPAAAIFTAVNPFGAYTAAAGMAAKELGTTRRMQQVNRLAEEMRLGARPKLIEGVFANEPVFFSRGAQNMLNPTVTNQNQLRD